MNISLRKFFDTATGEPAGGEPVVELTPAQAMAKSGVLVNSDATAKEVPNIITEKKEEPPKTEVPPVATTTDTTEKKEGETETPPPPKKEETEAAKPPIEVKAEVPTQTWQEVLKKEQPNVVLQELLGANEDQVAFIQELKDAPKEVVGLLRAWKEGKTEDYLRELTTDYSKMPADEVMRHQLRQDYPKATKAQLDILFQDEVIDKYKLDPEHNDEATVERGRLLLEARADKSRDALVANQQKFLLPKAPEAKAAEPAKVDDTAAKQQKAFEDYKLLLDNHPYTKELVTNKSISFGDGEEKFNFPIDTEALKKILADPAEWNANLMTPDGKHDIEKELLVAMVIKYGKQFLPEYAKHFKAIGGKSAIAPIENVKPKETTEAAAAKTTPKSPAEAMAKDGVVVNPQGR